MYSRLGTLLRSLGEHLDLAVQASYRNAGLDYRPRFTPIVRHLIARGPSSLRAIAAEVQVSHSAISQTVSEMQRLGLITKQPGQDAREQVVSLSERAVELLPSLTRCWAQTEDAAKSLSADLGVDLEGVLEDALRQLERRSFSERISASDEAALRHP